MIQNFQLVARICRRVGGYHAGVDGPGLVTGTKHPGSYGLHVEVGLALGHGDDPYLALLQLEWHCGGGRACHTQEMARKTEPSS